MKVTKRKLEKFIEEEIKNILNEASLSRVKDKAENQMIPFAMISAFRGDKSRDENFARQRQLEKSFEAGGFTWNKMPGSGYVEEPEEEGGESREVKENSILVWAQGRDAKLIEPKLLFELAQKLAGNYNQDSFIYGAAEDIAGQRALTVRVYTPDGHLIKEPWAGPWYTIQQAADDDFYWSVIGSKRTKLVELRDKWRKAKAGSVMGAVKKQYYYKAAKSGLKWIDAKIKDEV